MDTLHHIEIGFQVYAVEGGEMFGAVRGYAPEANKRRRFRGAPERCAACTRWEGDSGRRAAGRALARRDRPCTRS